ALGDLLAELERFEEGVALLREEREWFDANRGELDLDSVNVTGKLGRHLLRAHKFGEAEPLLRSALERTQQLGRPVEGLLIPKRDLGYLLSLRGNHEEGEKLLREALATSIDLHGEGSITVARVRVMLGKALDQRRFALAVQGKRDEADQLLRREVLPLMERA